MAVAADEETSLTIWAHRIEGNGSRAKFWLADGRLADARGYNRRQLAQIEAIVDAPASSWSA